MKFLTQIKSESVPIQVALFSFIGGSILLFIGLLFPLHTVFIMVAIGSILTMVFTNAIFALGLIYRLITSPLLRMKSLKEILIILANIPIAALYFFIIYNQNNLF